MNSLIARSGFFLPVSWGLLVAALWLAPVSVGEASTLYRCKDKNGVTAYTSSKSGYTGCTLVGNFQPDRTPPPAAPKPATPTPGAVPPGGQVEFRTAAGSAEPKAPTPPPAAASKGPPRVMRGAVYRYVKDGVTHYTNQRPSGSANAQVLFTYIETCYACGTGSSVNFNAVALNLTAYADEIAAASAQHGVDEALIRAVIHAESAFNPNAVSRAGAQGLMQLMPATAKRFGVEDPFTPVQNISGGVQYLAWLSKRFNGDLTRITAGYNAGEGAVDRHGGVPPYAETVVYVERVAILRDRYSKELSAARSATTATATSAVPVIPTPMTTSLP